MIDKKKPAPSSALVPRAAPQPSGLELFHDARGEVAPAGQAPAARVVSDGPTRVIRFQRQGEIWRFVLVPREQDWDATGAPRIVGEHLKKDALGKESWGAAGFMPAGTDQVLAIAIAALADGATFSADNELDLGELIAWKGDRPDDSDAVDAEVVDEGE